MKVAVITGGSSGIGLQTADMLAASGWRVYELSRHGKSRASVTHITCDITDDTAAVEAMKTVVDAEGKIDLLVNNAGTGVSGAVEFISAADTQKQFTVNVFGTVNMIRAVLPYMRKARKGRIINVSSIAAPVAIPFQAYYSASKAAINSLTLSVANEVRPYGITVCAVMPGDTKTGFTAARAKTVEGDDEYGGRISRSVELMEKDETNGVSPKKVARLIVKLSCKRHIRPFYSVGLPYKAATCAAKLLPTRVVNWLVGKIYAS